MDPNKLIKDELTYELRVRGFDEMRGETANSMRKKLQELLANETFGHLVPLDTFQPSPIEEIKVVLSKVESLENLITVKPIVEGSDILILIDTKLRHLTARLQRLKIEDTEENKPTLRAVDNLLSRLETIEENVDQKLAEHRSQVLAATGSIAASASTPGVEPTVSTVPIIPTVVTSVHKRQVEPSKWGIVFDGEKSSSISAFLEQVEERRRASNISERELLASAVDILKGSALIFYRSIRDEVTSWDDFKNRFREEFQPFDYQQELLQEIRQRSQGHSESVGIYFACMKNLFSRLNMPLNEAEKLNILRRNLHPYFIHNLGLAEFNTVDELLRLCKRLETNRLMADRCHPPPTRNLLEPDLSYPSGSSTSHFNNARITNNTPRNNSKGPSVAAVEEKCWNCLRPGHKFNKCRVNRTRRFCFGCGEEGVIKKDCSKCSGNVSGDVNAGQRRQVNPSR